MPAPEVFENNILEYSATIHDLLHRGTDIPGQRAPTPWRMVGERKVVGIGEYLSSRAIQWLIPEIETYSGSSASAKESSIQSTEIDIASMFLDKSLFPPALWKEVFENVSMAEGNKRKREERESESIHHLFRG